MKPETKGNGPMRIDNFLFGTASRYAIASVTRAARWFDGPKQDDYRKYVAPTKAMLKAHHRNHVRWEQSEGKELRRNRRKQAR